MDIAKELVDEAKSAGADAVKFQTYKTEKRVKKDAPIFDILKKCELSNKETKEIYDYCKKKGIIFFSTPFDVESVDFLYDLGVPLYKVASFDIAHTELLKHVASKKRPIIFSRGMASEEEIREAIKLFEDAGTPFALLHCVSSYPTEEKDANLSIIRTLQQKFDCPIGYSDHTLGIKVPALAVAVGAQIVEKHFTLDKNMDGPDQKMSCDPKDLKKIIKEIRKIESILGSEDIRLLKCEEPITQYRRKS